MTKESDIAWKFVGFGCIGCLGVIAVVAVAFGWLFFQGREDVTPVVKDFLDAVEGEQYEIAYDMVGEEWKKEDSFDQFRAFLKLVNDTLGARRSLTSRGFSYEVTTQGRSAIARYLADYENDGVTLTVTLRKYGDQWKVEGCNYDSKLFAKRTVCPQCGTANDVSSKYCSQCGAQLTTPQKSTVEEPGKSGT